MSNYSKIKASMSIKYEQIYFQLCESCFWCASRLHLSPEEKNKHLAKCPYCNEVRLRSLPLTEN
jgi:hypothetical protein